MEINEAFDALQTLVHCEGISREHEALGTIRTALAVVQNSSHNNARDEICPHFIVYNKGGSGEFCRCDCAGKLPPVA